MAGRASPLDPAPRTFFGVPSVPDLERLDVQVAFLGVPYDGGTPQPGHPDRAARRAGGGAGGRRGAVLLRGRRLGGAVGWYDVESDRDLLAGVTMADVGDVAIQGSDTEANYERISAAARAIAERGALLAAIGGDHSISYPLGRGLEPLGAFDVVHVDAHADFLDELGGARLTGASQLRRLAELPFVGTVTAIGLRNADREEIDGLREHGGRWATTRDVLERGAARGRARDRAARGCALRVDRPRRARLRDRARATRCRSRAGSATATCARSWRRSRGAGA